MLIFNQYKWKTWKKLFIEWTNIFIWINKQNFPPQNKDTILILRFLGYIFIK